MIFIRIAFFLIYVDLVTLGWGIKKRRSSYLKALKDEVEQVRLFEEPILAKPQKQEKLEDKNKTVPKGLILEGGEIEGTEHEVEEDEAVGVVPDVVGIVMTFVPGYLEAQVSKNGQGEPILWIRDASSGLEFYVTRLKNG